jgi:tight adherence protein B
MIFSLFIFAAVTLGLIGGYFAFTSFLGRDASLVRRRIDGEFRNGQDELPASPLFKKPDQLNMDHGVVDPNDLDRAPPSFPAAESVNDRLQRLLDQAALTFTVQQVLIATAGLGLVLGIAGIVLRGPLLGIPGALIGAAAPLLYVNARRNARREKVLAQLPNAFDLMARIIRAGQSVSQALQAVTEAFEDPVAGEFASCLKQQNLGMRPDMAFHVLAERTGILEMRLFVMAMVIQRQSGGNLSEVLERIARLIRERLRLRNQVRTLTAEGRLQGVTLLVLPVLMFGVMMVVNRSYAEVLLEQPYLLLATGTSMLIGALWIRKIVKFDI